MVSVPNQREVAGVPVLVQEPLLPVTVLETCLLLFKSSRLSQSDSHKVWQEGMH